MSAILEKLKPPVYQMGRDQHPTHPFIVFKQGGALKRFNSQHDADVYIEQRQWVDSFSGKPQP